MLGSNELKFQSMAYRESKKLTAEEKKLQALRIQPYGKEKPLAHTKEASNSTTFRFHSGQTGEIPSVSSTAPETSFLKQDLIKIGILATLVFIVQALLFVSMNKGLINL